MGPDAKGQLIERPSGFFARVRITIDGERVRKCVDLETRDRLVARRKLARILAGDVTPTPASIAAPLTFAEATAEALARWKGRTWNDGRPAGLRTARERFRLLERLALPLVGTVAVEALSVGHVLDVLERAAASGLSRQTLVHLKNALAAVLVPFVDRGVLPSNPAKVAKLRAVDGVQSSLRKERAILGDAELAIYLAWRNPDAKNAKATRERQTMAVVSRCFGGLRTGDLHAMRWEHFDPPAFLRGLALRQKTARPQALEVPDVLRPYLVAWWEEHGRPTSGLVFPMLRGGRAGLDEKHGVSHADALRRDLFRAGVRCHACTRHPPMALASWPSPCCDAFAADPLYVETATTLPVDFHSFRRAYNSGLAYSNVNLQQAMRLAGHADAKTHMRYVMRGAAPLATPAAALPKLPAAPPGNRAAALPGSLARGGLTPARHTGFEPVAFGSGGASADGHRESFRDVAPALRSSDVPSPAVSRGVLPNAAAQLDPIDTALAVALERASAAGAWATVEKLAAELEARRKAAAASLYVVAPSRARR